MGWRCDDMTMFSKGKENLNQNVNIMKKMMKWRSKKVSTQTLSMLYSLNLDTLNKVISFLNTNTRTNSFSFIRLPIQIHLFLFFWGNVWRFFCWFKEKIFKWNVSSKKPVSSTQMNIYYNSIDSLYCPRNSRNRTIETT